MAVKAVKFGGTSLCNAENFTKVKNIIMADKARKYVVPSAPGKRFPGDEKITDLLYLCYAKSSNGFSFDETFAQITERYVGIETELGLKTNISAELAAIKKNIIAGASEDYIASRGEYLSGLLLADYLGYDFYDAAELISFHADGTYDDETTQKWTQKLADSENVVVPGFYGRKRDGSIKTFSRGGSDITGAIVARAVQADVYENWTDVSGFLMADPRIVDNPKVISVVTYSELRELSYMGATVLHEDAIFPVLQVAIPINVKNTNQPGEAGTMIVPSLDKDIGTDENITGIAGKKNFTVITIEKNGMNIEIGFGRKVLSCLEKFNISFEHIPSGIDSICVVIADSKVCGCIDDLVNEIHRVCEPDSIEISDNMALIATVGRGMIRRVGISAKLFAALAEKKINVRMIDQGSSEMNIIVGVENDDFEDAVRAIYNALV